MGEPTPPPTPPGPEVPPPATPSPSGSYPSYPSYPASPSLPAYGAPDQQFLPPPSKAMAGWALGLAIIPCLFPVATLVSIGLAITVLVRSRDGRNHGKGQAIAALIIATLWIVGVIVAVVVGAFNGIQRDAERDDSGQVKESSQISTLKLREGDCFDHPGLAELDPTSDEPAEATMLVTAIPCAEPHDFEAYHAYELTDEDYPGDQAVTESATTACFAQFKRFVGIPYRKSVLEPYFFYPTSRSWSLLDDKTITCLIGEPGKKTSGSVRGSRR